MRRLLFLVAVVLFTIATFATMVKPMSVEDLAKNSSAVIEGQAVESWTSWNAEHTRIYTYTRVKVSQALKGSQSDTVVVKQIGGSAGGYTQHVAGVQHMTNGEKAMLFLRPSEAHDGTMVVVGLMQGHFRIARDRNTGAAMVTNGVLGAEEISGQTVQSYRGAKLTLNAMEARVRKAVSHE